VTAAAGQAFAALFRAMKLVRRDRPIHPEGLSLTGELTRTGSSGGSSGLDWVDTPGTDLLEARFSRSVGLPQKLPDILGLALRISPNIGDGGGPGLAGSSPADVLFASTGWQFPGRFLLWLKLDVASAALTTLMPYRGQKGPVLLGLRTLSLPAGSLADGEWVLALHWATPAGPWHECGEVRLRAALEPQDTPIRFNPLNNQLPGTQLYAWTRRLRERSYRAAQRGAPAAIGPSGAQNLASSASKERNSMSTVSRLFNSPSEDVWKVIADGWLYSGWVVGASRIRAVDAQWPEVDARLHHSVGAWPLVIDDSTRVTAVETGRSLELVARGWPLGEAKVVITLEDVGTQCRVTMAEDAIRGPGKLVPKAVRDPLISARNTETLKRLELMAAGGAGR
jgi:hypothetical protein